MIITIRTSICWQLTTRPLAEILPKINEIGEHISSELTRYRQMKELLRSNIAGKQQVWDLNVGCLIPESIPKKNCKTAC